jgi:hypothetical protein
MKYRAITKRKAENSVVNGCGIVFPANEDVVKIKRARIRDVHHEVEDLTEILHYLDNGNSTTSVKIPTNKCSSNVEMCQQLRGDQLDHNAYKWWLSRFGIEDHVSTALLHQVQPERSTSKFSVNKDITLPVFPVDSNICTVDAAGATGLRRMELHKSSNSLARHYKPILDRGVFSWGENFTFSSHSSEGRDLKMPPVDIASLRPFSLLSVPPVQRLHLVEPFRPVPPALKHLILERTHLLSPSENKLCFPSGQKLYTDNNLSSGRKILRVVSERIHINGLDAIPPAPPSPSEHTTDKNRHHHTGDNSTTCGAGGSGSDSGVGVISLFSAEPPRQSSLQVGGSLSPVHEGDEATEEDNEEDGIRNQRSRSIIGGSGFRQGNSAVSGEGGGSGLDGVEVEHGFEAGFMLDPADVEHMARQYDEEIEEEERIAAEEAAAAAAAIAAASGIGSGDGMDDFGEGYDNSSAYLQQTQELELDVDMDGRQGSLPEGPWDEGFEWSQVDESSSIFASSSSQQEETEGRSPDLTLGCGDGSVGDRSVGARVRFVIADSGTDNALSSSSTAAATATATATTTLRGIGFSDDLSEEDTESLAYPLEGCAQVIE